MKRIAKHNKTLIVIYLLALSNILIHLIFADTLEYHRDELLYFSLGQHPDFGYLTVPPLIGWIAFVMKSIFGFSIFAVKLFPALLSGGLVILSSSITREFGGTSYAQLLTAIAIIVMPVTLRAFHLFQPVHIDLFFWTLIIYYILRYINTQKEHYLMFVGIVIGFALLNKYLVLVLVIGLLFSMFFTSERQLFRKRSFYFGLAISLLIFLPNLLWQMTKGFPVFGHMEALNSQQLVNVDRIDFLIDQLMMPFAVSLIILPGLWHLLFHKKYKVLGYTVLLVVIILLVLRGKSYYTIGIFPLLVAAGAVFIEKNITKRLTRILIPMVLIAISVSILPFGIPIYEQDEMVAYYKDLEDDFGLILGRRFEDGSIHSLPQDYADQLGWKELTTLTALAYEQIPEKQKAIIYCENYGQAGAISVIGKQYNLPEPLCFHESFVYWIPNKFNPDIEYFIYINDELGDDIKELFQEIKVVGQVSNSHSREFGSTVYLCSKPKRSFNKFWKSVVQELSEEQMF